MQDRNRDTNVEDAQIVMKGNGDGIKWEIGIDIYAVLILCIKPITNEKWLYSTGNSTQW